MSESFSAPSEPQSQLLPPVIAVLGAGGAGGNVAAALAQAAWPGVTCRVLDTCWRALQMRTGLDTLLLGRSVCGGLSAGGDPKQGRAAAEAEEAEIQRLVAGTDIVLLLAGLGGGTGSGAAPVVARAAKAAGAWVVALVSLPFEMEGSRRRRQALLGLSRLRQEADITIPLANQPLLDAADGQLTVPQLFAAANERLAQAVLSLWRTLALPGPMTLDLGALRTVTSGRPAECVLAAAEAAGDNRTFDLWAQLNQNPALQSPAAWEKFGWIMAGITGGPDLLPADIEWLGAQIRQQAPHAQLLLGVGCDAALQGRLALTLLAAHHSDAAPEPADTTPSAPQAAAARSTSSPEDLAQTFLPPAVPRPTSRYVPPPPSVSPEKARQLYRKQGRGRKPSGGGEQVMLPLEVVSKGRFEKSDPTIRDGEDLDVPTYIRRGVVLN